MTVYVSMQAPTTWPFLTPVVPAHLMPSGNAYRPDASGQIQANQADVGALAGYGFALPGSKLPSITDTGTLVTIAADAKITGSLDVAEHLHFHESADPGTPNAGGVFFADEADHKLKYTFHDGTTTALAPASGGGSSGLVLIDSGTVSSPVAFLDVTLPAGYFRYWAAFGNVQLSTSDALVAAMSQDGGATFINDPNGYDSYLFATATTIGAPGSPSYGGISHDVVGILQPINSAISADIDVFISPGTSGTYGQVRAESGGYFSPGGTLTAGVGTRWFTPNPAATITPSPGRINLLRFLPYGFGDVDPPTSGETVTALSWTLFGWPNP